MKVNLVVKCPGWSTHPPNIVWIPEGHRAGWDRGDFNNSVYDNLYKKVELKEKLVKFTYDTADRYTRVPFGRLKLKEGYEDHEDY